MQMRSRVNPALIKQNMRKVQLTTTFFKVMKLRRRRGNRLYLILTQTFKGLWGYPFAKEVMIYSLRLDVEARM